MKKRLVVLLIAFGVLIACKKKCGNSNTYTTFDQTVENSIDPNYLKDGREKLFFGIVNQKGDFEIERIYYLNGNVFTGHYIDIGNFVNEDREYSLLVLVNYRQQEFFVEDKKYDFYTVTIQKNKDLKIPIEIRELQEGINDIIILIIPNATKDLTEQERMERGIKSDIYCVRCNAIVGRNENRYKLERTLVQEVYGANTEMCLSTDNSGLAINTPYCKLSFDSRLYLTVGNMENYKQEYVVLLLKDWKQIPFYNEKDSIYFKLNADTQCIIPADIELSDSFEHELVAIAVKNPFKTYDFYSEDLNSSVRVKVSTK